MKLDSTIEVDQTLLPNTSPARWNQTVSKMRPAAPESRQIAARRMDDATLFWRDRLSAPDS
jgi:hypothetical protein